MLIKMTSVLSGVTRTKDIDVTQTQLDEWLDNDRNIQDALPHLSDDDREFLMTGITPEEWDDAFGEEE